VVGLCDLLPERLTELGDELGVADRFTDLHEMIRQTDPDIVAVPTGTEYHHDLCMQVLEHGRRHIDVEKPMCVDLVQSDSLLARADELGARVAVHHQGRTGPAMAAVSQAVCDGRIGRLRHVVGSGKGYYGGYGLMNIGTHVLNAMLEVTGHCRRVSAGALTDGRPIGPDDVVPSPGGMGTIAGEHITASLEFDGSVTASLLQHRFPKMDIAAHMIEFFGTEGRLFWKTGKSGHAWRLPVPHYVPGATGFDWEPLEFALPQDYDPGAVSNVEEFMFVDDYVHALDDGREHTCSGREAGHVLEIMMGIFESAAYGRTVTLPQPDREHPLLRWRRDAGQEAPSAMPRDYPSWLAEEDRRLGRG
jgi:predicted dehydrogenase